VLTGPAGDLQRVVRPRHRVAERLKHPGHSSTELRQWAECAHRLQKGVSVAGPDIPDQVAEFIATGVGRRRSGRDTSLLPWAFRRPFQQVTWIRLCS
jgi:hypothetical protein